MRRDADFEAAVASAGERRRLRQVLADVAPEEKEIGDEQDAGGPAGDTAIDPGLDIGSGRLEVARLDDTPREADPQRAGDAAQDAVRRTDAAAVADHEERRARGATATQPAHRPRVSQRAGPRIVARRRRSLSTTSNSL